MYIKVASLAACAKLRLHDCHSSVMSSDVTKLGKLGKLNLAFLTALIEQLTDILVHQSLNPYGWEHFNC